MSLLRVDVDCGRVAVPAAAGVADRNFSGGLAGISLCEPDLSAAGLGFDARVFWVALLSGSDDRGDSGRARAAAQGDRSIEAHLCGIYSLAMDTGGDAFCEWAARFAEKPGVLPDGGGE